MLKEFKSVMKGKGVEDWIMEEWTSKASTATLTKSVMKAVTGEAPQQLAGQQALPHLLLVAVP
jgi:hypothetical protein